MRLLDVLAATCALVAVLPAIARGRTAHGGLMGHYHCGRETGGQPVIAVDAGPGFDNAVPGQRSGPRWLRGR